VCQLAGVKPEDSNIQGGAVTRCSECLFGFGTYKLGCIKCSEMERRREMHPALTKVAFYLIATGRLGIHVAPATSEEVGHHTFSALTVLFHTREIGITSQTCLEVDNG